MLYFQHKFRKAILRGGLLLFGIATESPRGLKAPAARRILLGQEKIEADKANKPLIAGRP
jgi:hypothetical protein